MKSLFQKLVSPLYNRLVWLIAYGAWGPGLHQLFIRIFCRLYNIDASRASSYRRLGDFFLRELPFSLGRAALVSPAESKVLIQAARVENTERLQIKNLEYRWSDFPELREAKLKNFYFWNLYLAPSYYHWVHFPCDLKKLEVMYSPGASFPVNSWGQKMCPWLYNANERLSFRGFSDHFGQVYFFCVAALAVSGFESSYFSTDMPQARWLAQNQSVKKGDKAAGFRLGSSVLLLTEKMPFEAETGDRQLLCGQNLVQAPQKA